MQASLSNKHSLIFSYQRTCRCVFFICILILKLIMYNWRRLCASWNLPFAGGLYRHLGFTLKPFTKMTHETLLPQNLEFYTLFINLFFLRVSHSLSNFISVSGLKCYECIGTDKTCSKDELKKDSSKESTCASGMDRCMRVWAKKGDTTAVVNSCSNESLCKTAEDAKCDVDKCAVGCCDTDLCNAGSPVSFSMFLMTVCCTLGLALLK